VVILVTGGTGQVATSLGRLGRNRVRVAGRPALDFDRPETIAASFHAARPSLVVNTAAWTAVDEAEMEPDAARRANAEAPATLAALCRGAGIPLIHVSTDYVFDGDKGAPYTEDDAPNPTGVYGRTKLEGERAALLAWERTVVLRTSWVYSATGKNFVRTMLRAARKAPQLRVVGDQRGCPTAADELAIAILAVADQVRDWRPAYRGVFHVAGTGDTTWYGLATAAFAEAARHGLKAPPVQAIATADWPTPARRPLDSRLDCGKFAGMFDIRLPAWRDSLVPVVDALLAPFGV
jgi:dTDP-4-dehydrorhamnose reductase